MSSFTYFTSQNNLVVIKLLHHSALRPPAEFYHYFVIVIALGVIVSLICYRPKTFFELGPVQSIRHDRQTLDCLTSSMENTRKGRRATKFPQNELSLQFYSIISHLLIRLNFEKVRPTVRNIGVFESESGKRLLYTNPMYPGLTL